MDAKIDIKLQPFRVPNYVLVEAKARKKQDGFSEPDTYHLSQLSDETLDKLCQQFKDNVFAKARNEINQ